MKITKVEAIPFGVPIRSFADAYTGFGSSNAVLVKIHTDEGLTGFGEACAWESRFHKDRAWESSWTSRLSPSTSSIYKLKSTDLSL
jgi:L-alanine-DL-glutamate epimerase-like enolase superfamily enzyme